MYLLKVGGKFEAKMGQFYMLRAWDQSPLLSRPISIYRIDEEGISFLYKLVGTGTNKMAGLRPGDSIKMEGPYGNGFEKVSGRVALVGGGIGIAPRSEEHTSELQSRQYLVCRLLLEKKKPTSY